jgi:hypothetical protein
MSYRPQFGECPVDRLAGSAVAVLVLDAFEGFLRGDPAGVIEPTLVCLSHAVRVIVGREVAAPLVLAHPSLAVTEPITDAPEILARMMNAGAFW